MDKKRREELEYTSLYADERFAKKAWKNLIGAALEGPGKKLPTIIDPKTEEPTLQSIIDKQAYESVKARLETEGKTREPMQAELIVESNIIRARFTDATFNTILDRTAGKVREEIAVSNSPFEDLTDDELEALMKYRESKAQQPEERQNSDDEVK